MRILFFGDIFGEPGREALKNFMPEIKSKYQPDFCIANGENAAGGRGISYNIAQEIFDCGIDVITMGNHTWARKEVLRIIDSGIKIIRPANYPKGVPVGKLVEKKESGCCDNLLGRIYMEQPIDCPFQTIDENCPAERTSRSYSG